MTPQRETLEIVFTWPETGREEVRYRRQLGTDDARKLMQEVDELQARAAAMNEESPYSYRFVAY